MKRFLALAGIGCVLAASRVGLSASVVQMGLLGLLLAMTSPAFVAVTAASVLAVITVCYFGAGVLPGPPFPMHAFLWVEAVWVVWSAQRGWLTRLNLQYTRPVLVARGMRGLLLAVALACLGAVFCRKFPLASTLAWAVMFSLLYWTAAGRLRSRPVALRAWMINAAVMGASVLIGLGILEIAARVLLDVPASSLDLFEPDPDYVYRFKPGGSGTFQIAVSEHERRDNEVRVSSQGIRDREFGPKAAGEFRILMLGDSYTMGYPVRPEDSIPKQLERLLNGATARSVTVINAGMTGAGPLQELGILRTQGWSFAPDLVVLQLFAGNDIENSLEVVQKHLRAYSPDLQEFVFRCRMQLLLPYRVETWLRGHSHAFRAFEKAVRQTEHGGLVVKAFRNFRLYSALLQPPLPPVPKRPFWMEQDLADWYPELEEGMAILEADVRRIRDECHQHQVPLIAFCAPMINDVDDASWEKFLRENDSGLPYERRRGLHRFESFLEQEGVPVCSLMDTLKAQPDVDKVYYRFDLHFTEFGNRLVAECLRDFLRAHHLLPE